MDVAPTLVEWLLESKDPSVRYRVLTEIMGRSPTDPEVLAVAAERGRTGWAASVLAHQLPDGQWDNPGTGPEHLYRPKYIATNWRLLVLADLGMTRAHPGVSRAAELLFRAHLGSDGDLGGTGSEICFTGNALRMLTQFGYGADPRLAPVLAWVLGAQKPDGGWHCFPSETGTLDGWEGLAALAAIPPEARNDAIRRAVASGAEFYLKRGLLEEGPAYPPWRRLHYPVHYYYDVLVGLDMLSALGYGRDARMGPALDLLESKRNPEGGWNADANHPDLPMDEEYQPSPPYYPFVLEAEGRPSRWITLNALRVLDRAGRA